MGCLWNSRRLSLSYLFVMKCPRGHGDTEEEIEKHDVTMKCKN